MKLIEDEKLDFSDVLIRPKRSIAASRSSVDLLRTFRFYYSKLTWTGVPIIAANMSTTGTLAMVSPFQKRYMMVALHKHYTNDEILKLYPHYSDSWIHMWYTIGMSDNDMQKMLSLKFNPPYINIDVANGYTDSFVSSVARVREKFPQSVIMAGNVCTPEMVQELILHGGADIVKIGIGPGSVCTTRLVTGVGYPQLSAILECADAAHGLKQDNNVGRICADGGCVTSGDIVKAFGANADFVMIGGMISGCDECEGDWEYSYYAHGKGEYVDKKKQYLKFYGMSSYEAQDKYNGGRAEHRASEGKVVKVPYKGPVDDVLKEIEGGLRSACAYTGAMALKDLGRTTTFVRVNRTHNRVFE